MKLERNLPPGHNGVHTRVCECVRTCVRKAVYNRATGERERTELQRTEDRKALLPPHVSPHVNVLGSV